MELKIDFDAQTLLAAAEKAPKETAQEVRRALLESCRVVQRTARRQHSFKSRTGALERAIEYRVERMSLEGVIWIRPDVAPYGGYVHNGTGIFAGHSPWKVTPTKKKMLRWSKDGKFFFSKGHEIQGQPADEFLYSSAEKNRQKINDIFARHMDEAMRAADLK
jgi:HK97 gp10 family phage protein